LLAVQRAGHRLGYAASVSRANVPLGADATRGQPDPAGASVPRVVGALNEPARLGRAISRDIPG
jgi:hypothetical protein